MKEKVGQVLILLKEVLAPQGVETGTTEELEQDG